MLTGRLQCCLAGKKRNDIVVNIQTFSSCFELWLGGEGKGGSERKRGTNDNRTLSIPLGKAQYVPPKCFLAGCEGHLNDIQTVCLCSHVKPTLIKLV